MPTYEPVLLANIHKENSHKLAVYEAGGGYRALRKAMKEMSPDDVLATVRTSGLRGRGGAGFPTALKWSFLPKDHAGPIYLCVNADESEPGTFVNRVQMEADPHQVVEGIILSAYATKTTTAYLYLRYEYPLSRQRMQAAIDEAYSAGYLGKNILGSSYSLDLFIHRGAGAYVCGEETGLIESLEGKRAWPRIKPPFPRRGRPLSQADRGEQRRDDGLRDAHHRPRRRTGSARSAFRPIPRIPATLAASDRSSTASAAT